MKEDNFIGYLKEKERVHLSEDFDKDMMTMINKHALSNSEDKKYLRLMYLFFVSGLLLGFVIAVSFVDLELVIGGNRHIVYRLVLMFPLIVTILFVFHKVYKATMVRMGKEKFSLT